MKKGLIAVLMSVIVLSGCGVSKTTEQGVVASSQDTTSKEDELNVVIDDEVCTSNVQIFMDKLTFTDKDAVLGSVQRLNSVGCGAITDIYIIEGSDNVYVLKVTDEDGDVFQITMDSTGYIGPIQDNDGNYLYMPID